MTEIPAIRDGRRSEESLEPDRRMRCNTTNLPPIPGNRKLAGFSGLLAVLTTTGLAFGQQTVPDHPDEPVVGLPCEGCEAVFEGLPADPPSVARIAPPGEPGESLRIVGTAYDVDGRPEPGVIVYAYHTNDEGIYPRDERYEGFAARHGRLRAWATTDANGRYEFDTIVPGHYPGRGAARHVHMHVIEAGCCTYYIDSIHFTNDPLLDEETRARAEEARGGRGLVTPRRGEDGVLVVERDIYLGRNVPGYEKVKATVDGGRTSTPASR
jgi:protocatechuate 3,4-dioxygenase beta subunit